MTRSAYAVMILAAAVGLAAPPAALGLRHEDYGGLVECRRRSPVDSATLPTLVPPGRHPDDQGPDSIADNGIHLRFQVTGAPTDVMNAYKAASNQGLGGDHHHDVGRRGRRRRDLHRHQRRAFGVFDGAVPGQDLGRRLRLAVEARRSQLRARRR